MNRHRLAAAATLVVPLCLALLAVDRGAPIRVGSLDGDGRERGSRPGPAPDFIQPARVGAPPRMPAASPPRSSDGWTLSLPDVLFASGRWQLEDDALTDLDELARFLARHPRRQVAIEGHADRVGRAEDNRELSWRRVESVKAHLIGRGIADARIAMSAQGADLPVADNASHAGRRLNRRVAVTVLERVESPAALEVR